MTARTRLLGGLVAALLAAPAAAQAPAPPLSPVAVVDAFQAALGPFRGNRPSHGKGFCASGSFTATPDGTRLSVSPVFSGQPIPTLIRFGVGGAGPGAPDTARSTRGLSIRFQAPGGVVWDMANISVPIFGAATPQALVEGLLARAPDPATGRPNPEKVAAFAAANPSSALQGRWLAANPPPASFATTPYWGVNTFRFRGQDGEVRPARWVFEPAAGTERLTEEQMRTLPAHYLADELRRRVAAGPVVFDMWLQFPGAGDDLVNPTIAWPDDRPRTRVGRLTVTEVAPDGGGACQGISYMFLAQAPGVELSDDPTLRARQSSYAVSLQRRSQ
jgi:catalase